MTSVEKEEVVGLGGLHVVGTERHESRRIDNQVGAKKWVLVRLWWIMQSVEWGAGRSILAHAVVLLQGALQPD